MNGWGSLPQEKARIRNRDFWLTAKVHRQYPGDAEFTRIVQEIFHSVLNEQIEFTHDWSAGTVSGFGRWTVSEDLPETRIFAGEVKKSA